MTERTKEKFRRMLPVFVLFAAACLLGGVVAWIDDIPPRDVAMRYAPMAEAFARGDWQYAFHPRVPLLFPVLSGAAAWVFRLDGFRACRLTSMLFFALTLFPLRGALRRVFDERVACWGALMGVFCSQMMRLAADGWREPVKGFLIALAAYALVRVWRERKAWAGYLLAGVAAGAVSSLRSDSVVFALFLLLLAGLFELKGRKSLCRTAAAGAVFLAVLSPLLTVNYFRCGYFVPDVRFAEMAEKLFPAKKPSAVSASSASSSAAPAGPVISSAPPRMKVATRWERRRKYGFSEFAGNFVMGFYPFFAVPALVGMWLRLRRKTWNHGDTLLLTLWLGHNLLIALELILHDGNWYLSKRYLLPASMLSLGWAATGILVVWDCLKPLGAWRVFAPFSCAVALWLDAAWPGIKARTYSRHYEERQAMLKLGAAVRSDYRGERFGARKREKTVYYSPRKPWIFFLYDGQDLVHTSGGGPAKGIDDADYLVLKTGTPALPGSENFEVFAEADGYRKKYQLWRRKIVAKPEN